MNIDSALAQLPVVAILRGIQPTEAVAIGRTLYGEGLRAIEVPLNSPSALTSIQHLASSLPEDCLVGAGTVLASDDVIRVRDAGGQLVVTPNTNPEVIQAALAAGLQIVPGVATATEALLAVHAGATHLKLFPASTYGPAHVAALQVVLPTGTKILAVGGVGPADFKVWCDAGVAGFGIGTALYRPGDTTLEVQQKAAAVVAALKSLG